MLSIVHSCCQSMRWLLSTLVATSPLLHNRARHLSPTMFGKREPKASMEEYSCVSGVWRAEIELDDDGNLILPMHLAAPRSTNALPSSGSVYLMKENLPDRYCPSHFEPSWWSVNRQVHAGSQGDHILCLSLQLGHLFLKGRGQRDRLRCQTFVGIVEDSDGDPCGRFTMRLSLPIKTDTRPLENRYRKRVETRPPPIKNVVESHRPSLSEEEARRAWLVDRSDPSWEETRSQQLRSRGLQGDFAGHDYDESSDSSEATRDPGDGV